MSKVDQTVRILPSLASLPAAGANTGGIVRTGGHVYFDDGSVVTQLDRQVSAYFSIDSRTASWTLDASDLANAYARANFTAAGTVTIPPVATIAWPVGYTMPVSWVGGMAGIVSIAPGSGVTLRNTAGTSFSSIRLLRPGAIVQITHVATNVWEFVGPTNAFMVGTHYRSPTSTLVDAGSNTALTSLLPSGGYGVTTWPGNTVIYNGQGSELWGHGNYTTSATVPNSQVVFSLNGTAIFTAPITSLLAASATKFPFRMRCVFRRESSTTGSLSGQIDFGIGATGTTPLIVLVNPDDFTVDWTVAQTLDVGFQWLTGTAGNSITVKAAALTALN